MQILPKININYYGNGNQDRQIKNTRIYYTNQKQYNIDIVTKPNKKKFNYGMYPGRSRINSTCRHKIKTWIF